MHPKPKSKGHVPRPRQGMRATHPVYSVRPQYGHSSRLLIFSSLFFFRSHPVDKRLTLRSSVDTLHTRCDITCDTPCDIIIDITCDATYHPAWRDAINANDRDRNMRYAIPCRTACHTSCPIRCAIRCDVRVSEADRQTRRKTTRMSKCVLNLKEVILCYA